MRIELRGVTKGRRERALPETSLVFESGRAVLACTETEQRPTVLGLIASGRMRPDTGEVTVDGQKDAATIRRSVALVDALDVSEPEPNVSVSGVVAEELMFAGLASHPIAARRWLDGLGLGEVASTPIGNVEPGARVRILCELAALRPGVTGLVLTSPDRHGGDPQVWWSIAEEFAARGLAVLVIAGRASESVLGTAEAQPGAEGRSIPPMSDDSAPILLPSDDPPTEEPADLADLAEPEEPSEPAAPAEPVDPEDEGRSIPPSSEDSTPILLPSDDPPTEATADDEGRLS